MTERVMKKIPVSRYYPLSLMPHGKGPKVDMLKQQLEAVNYCSEIRSLKESFYSNLRNSYIQETEKAMIDPKERARLFQNMWRVAFYSTIVFYREAFAEKGIDPINKTEYIEFTKKVEKYLNRMLSTYPDISYDIYLSLGDMSRYTLDSFKDNSKFNDSLRHYAKAVSAAPNKGRTYNNLALLLNLQQNKPHYWRSICLFLRAVVSEEPFTTAMKSLHALFVQSTALFKPLQIAAIKYIEAMQDTFKASIMNGHLKDWQDALNIEFEKEKPDLLMIVETFVAVMLGSIAAMGAPNKKEDRTLYLVQVVGEDFKRLFKEIERLNSQGAGEERIRRRFQNPETRRAQQQAESEEDDDEDDDAEDEDESSTEVGDEEDLDSMEPGSASEYRDTTDEEDESETSDEGEPSTSNNVKPPEPNRPDFRLPLLTLLIEWFDNVDDFLRDKLKLNTGTRMLLQPLFQLIVDTANMYLDDLKKPEGEFGFELVSNRVIWTVKAPACNLPSTFYFQFIPLLLQEADGWIHMPIVFDKYYKATPRLPPPKNTGPTMISLKETGVKMYREEEKMRLQLKYRTSKLPLFTGIPTYAVVDDEIMITRMHVVKALTSVGTQLLLSHMTIRKFDSLKSNSAEARAAVRYLEEAMKTGAARIFPRESNSLLMTSWDFVDSEHATSFNGVLVVLLVGIGIPIKFQMPGSRDLPIWSEGVDSFAHRFATQLNLPKLM